MSINETAYDTTACSGYRYNVITDNVNKAFLMGGLKSIDVKIPHHDTDFIILQLQGGTSSGDSVQYFKHPIFIRNELLDTSDNVTGKLKVCIDVREFGRYDKLQDSFKVRNTPEYVWTMKRAILNKLWIEENKDSLCYISTIPAATYAALISESLARRFALDAEEQMIVSILACYFYYTLFTDVDFDEEAKNKVVGNISRITKIPAANVFKCIGDIQELVNLESLCEVIKTKLNNVALENLNVGTLFAACCGNWFGSNAREIMAVGLEHIPTWIMIVSASIESATFKRSTLSKISSRYIKGGAGDNFTKALTLMLGGKNAIEDEAYSSAFF